MSLRSLITRHLEQAAGVYMPNQFVLALDVLTPFIGGTDDHPTQNNDHLPVFTHEYWHYWHNVSTISGFKSFAFSQHLLVYFSPTILGKANGTSVGDAALSHRDKADLRTLITLQLDMDGQAAPREDLAADFDVDFSVTGIREHDDHRVYRGRKAPNTIVEIDVISVWPDGTKEIGSFRLGSLAIEESVAFLVEEQIRLDLPHLPPSPPPAFPYRVVERVLEHIVGPVHTSVAAALGTLSLLSTHPGLALITLARGYSAALSAGATPEAALQAVQADHAPGMLTTIGGILDSDLDELVQMHEGRGLMEGALKHAAATLRRALEHRRLDPLFDLRFLFPNPNANGLVAHQALFPPCDLLQERPGDEDDIERDAIHSFDPTPPDENGHRPTNFTRSLQAQQDYLSSHLDYSTGRIISSANALSKCPYFTACNLPLRTNSPEVCASRPWEAYQPQGSACWYSTAVAATLGKVAIQKV